MKEAKIQWNKVEKSLHDAITARRGHFLYESGHHGDLWLDLDGLFADARLLRGWAVALASQAVGCKPDIVCGPLTGGAFVAQFLAAELGADFAYADRLLDATGAVRYQVPKARRAALRGKHLLLADDAINAGSALSATLKDVRDCGGSLAGFASLLTLGDAASRLAGQTGAPFFTLLRLERRLWLPADCPLCAEGVALMQPLMT
jgi:orotate phosphoribosyltransferase